MSQPTVVTKPDVKIKMPSMWHVILHNDDFTPFDFVIELLTVIFNKSTEEAADLAATVHNKGKAIIGIYTREIAETKVMQSMSIASDHEHPLLLSAEQA